MINWLKKIIQQPQNKRIIQNFTSLSFVQIADYILPLITLPYLLRVLGPEKFGAIAFSQAMITYFQIFSDYGFHLSATREISIYRDNKKKVSEIFSSVIAVKLLLGSIGFVILLLLLLFIPKFSPYFLLSIFAYGLVVGNILFPIWFFQGIENMKYITILNVTAKLIFAISIFFLINTPEKYIYVPCLNSLGFIIAGITSLFIVYYKFSIRPVIPKMSHIKHQFKEGWHVFISTFSINLYSASNTLILGLFTNDVIVGYFAIADKLIRAAAAFFVPISQSIYPFISKLVQESKTKALLFIKKIFFFMSGLALFISIFTFIFAKPIILIFSGPKYSDSIILLQILAAIPLLLALSNIFGIQIMLNFNLKKAFSRILLSAGVINIILSLFFVWQWQAIGSAITFLISESFVTVAMFVVLEKNGIKILKGSLS